MRRMILPLVAVLCLTAFSAGHMINNCFISFNKAANLQMASPERLPEGSEQFRKLRTEKGEVLVSRIDGYRVLYNNAKQVPFVNMKVELSVHGAYNTDTSNVLDNIQYMNSHSPDMESKALEVFHYHGYRVSGLSRSNIEKGSTLGIFVLFPGNDVTVYFYFNNLKPGFRNFESLEDYKKQRDDFMERYTGYLQNCLNN